MQDILDLSKPFNPVLFEQVVNAFYEPNGKDRNQASEILHQFKDLDGNWTIIDQIMDKCQGKNAKFYGLTVLENTVKYKWLSLPVEQRNNMKNYTVGKVIAISSDSNSNPNDKANLSKWNMVLIEILKKEWPDNWPTFVSDLVGSSKSNEDLCDNNMGILKLLLEEVFEFNKESLTSQRSQQLQTALSKDLSSIYDLCMFAFTNSSRATLIVNSLDVIRLLLPFIQPSYIYDTELINTLMNYFTLPQYRCCVTQCLMELLSNANSSQYPAKVASWYTQYMEILLRHLPIENNLSTVYFQCRDEEQRFVHNVTLFLTNVLLVHTQLLESQHKEDVLLFSIKYINMLARLPDLEILKLCMQYYKTLANMMYQKNEKLNPVVFSHSPRNNSEGIYVAVLHDIRDILVDRMAKPEEILITENDDGEIIREERKDGDTIALYNIMKETLVLLSSINYEDTENIMLTKMEYQMSLSPSDPFRTTLQPLIWAVGSISGVTTHDREKGLLIGLLSDLLKICPTKKTKDDKAVVASCIMYVIQQYPGFLMRHWGFLRTVVNKTFEFMSESHPGVQDMACDTFSKLVKKCGKEFVKKQLNKENREDQPYIIDIIQNTAKYTSTLSPQQKESYYRSIGLIIKNETNDTIRLQYINTTIAPYNQQWSFHMQQATSNIAYLADNAVLKDIKSIIQINTVLIESLGDSYTVQLGILFNDVSGLYKYYHEYIADYIKKIGPNGVGHVGVRYMMANIRSILKYFGTFIEKSKNRDALTTQNIIQFIQMVILCYNNTPDCAKMPEILSFISLVISKLKEDISSLIPQILDAIYGGTLKLLTEDQIHYPELRLEFYNLLSTLAQFSFERLFSFAVTEQDILVKSIVWGFKHDSREICETSLQTMIKVLTHAKNAPDEFKQPFYSHFLIYILSETFYVLTDRMHVSTFQSQCILLQLIFKLILSGEVKIQLFENVPNNQSVANYLYQLFCSAFPNTDPGYINEFLNKIGTSFNSTEDQFRTIVRDFLIQLKEFSVLQTDLYQAEKDQFKKQELQAEYERKKNIPGLLNPNEIDDDLI